MTVSSGPETPIWLKFTTISFLLKFSIISPTPALAEKLNKNKHKDYLGASAARFVAAG